MSSFWNNQYDSFKDRHYAALFWSTLMALIGLLILTAYVTAQLSESWLREYWSEFGLPEYVPGVLPGLGLLILAWGILKFRKACLGNRGKLRRGPLSRDEWRMARSKLKNGMKPIQRPAARVPDTNLKY
jgi:hypothetical protein